MTPLIVYSMIACGMHWQTNRFWFSYLWPFHLGKEMGRILKDRNPDNAQDRTR